MHDIAGLVVRPDKSNTLAVGLDTHTVTRVTEKEVATHSQQLSHLCDVCGVWRGPTLRSLKAHQARHCTRALYEGGQTYEIEQIVDDATTDHGLTRVPTPVHMFTDLNVLPARMRALPFSRLNVPKTAAADDYTSHNPYISLTHTHRLIPTPTPDIL